MPAFTPNRNFYLPGGGSLGIGGDDEAADIDKINQNFQLLDTWTGTVDGAVNDVTLLKARNQQFVGTDADRDLVTGMKRGDTYQNTDGDFNLYVYDGSAWKNRTPAHASYITTTPNPASSYTPSWTAAGRIVDTHNFWSSTNPTRMTIPFTGIYEFSYSVRTNGIAAMTVNVSVNGTAETALFSSAFGTGGAATHVQFAGIQAFNAGDYITLPISYGASGGSGTSRIALNYLGEV